MELLPNNEDLAVRFRIAVGMVKLSRREFCKKHELNRFTIQSWELGSNSINVGLVLRFCEALTAEGVFCSPEWLIKGKGAGPVKLGARDDLVPEASILGPEEERKAILAEVELFRSNQILARRSPIVVEVADQAVRPYFSKGDFVGGYILSERSVGSLLGQLAIVGISEGKHVVRRLMRDTSGYLLVPTDYSHRAVSVKNVEHIAKIVWHRSC